MDRDTAPAAPTFREALRVWMKIGLLSFGGPTGQIALMHQELVERRRWVGEGRFLHALNYCMLLPGPEAQQLSIYIGWLLHRRWGGIVAGTLFVLPGALLLWAVSWLYLAHGDLPVVAAVFSGLQPAVLGIVAFATLRLGGKALRNPVLWGVALAAFCALRFAGLPFPLLILAAGLFGLAAGRLVPRWFEGVGGGHGGGTVIDDTVTLRRPTIGGSLRTAAPWLALWAAPVAAAWWIFGYDHVLTREGLLFSKAAVVTFGGAYAVLPYVAQQAVELQGWLSAEQMLDGLGLAETTPGPLVLVLQFVGFVGAWQHPGGLSPLFAATLGAGMAVWCTFIPGFLFIFLGAPYVEALRGSRPLACALTAITAAVVGVVLNLAVWFAGNVLVTPAGSLDAFASIVGVAVFLGLWKLRWNVVWVVPACGALGVARWLVLA